MSPGVPWRKLRSNRVVPVEDLTTERVEVRPGRFIRVLHFSPPASTTASEASSRRDSNTSCRERSVSLESQDRQDHQNIIVIFFIHGVGGCAELWGEQLRHFIKAGYAVVAPDLLGHGGSSAPKDQPAYEFSELANDMITIFDRFSKRRNILVGHSYGSSFCCLISSVRSRQVSKVVLISGGAPVPLRPESCSLFCLPTLMLAFIKPCLLWSYERGAFHRQHRSLTSCVRAFSAPLFVLKAVLQGQKWEVGDENFHSELMVPALLIHGAQDKFVTLEDEQWMQESIYSSSLEVIQDAGHMVMLEKPEKVNWFIHNFLQRDPTTRSRVLSPSREVSKDSIHVVAKTSSTRKPSLAVQSLPEHPVENTEISHSASQLRRCSAVSLTVPTTSVFKSNSLPSSSAHVNEELEVKIQFQGIEVKIDKNYENQLRDETVVTKECHHEYAENNTKDIITSHSSSHTNVKNCNEENNAENNTKNIVTSHSSSHTNVKNCNEEKTSITSCSPQQRRKGVSIVADGPMPSLEVH